MKRSWLPIATLLGLACGGGGDATLPGDGGTAGDGGGGVQPDGRPDPGPGAIGEWTDEPGACPTGATRADITTAAQMADASRGDGPIADCYFVHDGTYVQSGTSPILYFTRGGSAAQPVVWVGQSRAGVQIRGRASFDAGAPFVTLSNMTLDLTGYTQSGAFNTVTVLADHVTVRRLTVTGDCATGLRGGAIEVDGGADVLIEDNLIEKFGQCQGDGHLDHGVYLGSGSDITIRNNLVRGNSSRGIQLNTEGGAFGTLSGILIERNRITGNGHRDYEDGIVVNGAGAGAISNLVVRRNLIYRNYYAGIRFVGDAISGVTIEYNTFVDDGAQTSAPGRSEVNLDDGTPAGSITRNIFVAERTLINTCAPSLTFSDNVVDGPATGGCVGTITAVDPAFVDAAGGDFHPTATAASGYGAYAP